MPETPWYQNPLVIKFIGSLVRSALQGLGGILVAKQVITTNDAQTYLGALTDPVFLVGAISFVGGSGWSLYEKYLARKKLIVAIDAPTGTSETQITAIAKDKVPDVPAPSALSIR